MKHFPLFATTQDQAGVRPFRLSHIEVMAINSERTYVFTEEKWGYFVVVKGGVILASTFSNEVTQALSVYFKAMTNKWNLE